MKIINVALATLRVSHTFNTRPLSSTHPAQVQPSSANLISLNSTPIESPETDTKQEIPHKYMPFLDVFSKQLATKLPPHQPWDSAIDLLPGATLPKSKIYPLSILEQKAIDEYIEEALKQNLI